MSWSSQRLDLTCPIRHSRTNVIHFLSPPVAKQFTARHRCIKSSVGATIMCGIAGIVSQSSDLELIGSMTQAMSHRGPDGSGTWADGLCSLGHRRLAIIDLSDKGKQPLCNENGTVWIVFNGEIYNFQELRTELERFGHKFDSHTDTEVIVHAYEEWGTECVKRLR